MSSFRMKLETPGQAGAEFPNGSKVKTKNNFEFKNPDIVLPSKLRKRSWLYDVLYLGLKQG